MAERISRRPDARAAAHLGWELLVVHDLPTAALRTLEVERTPRNKGSIVREIDEVDEGLAVNLGGAHLPSMSSRSVREKGGAQTRLLASIGLGAKRIELAAKARKRLVSEHQHEGWIGVTRQQYIYRKAGRMGRRRGSGQPRSSETSPSGWLLINSRPDCLICR